ncbi:unnamed protein product [Cyclocybe aegerita]|uniref:Uncharacterized protein n=1 Tax=Cyclocybe aegerita TaxID=1973307 RepID=A0A8S0VWF6_CYCAE|nr:unnamed protein product [Cyclocybe aegerita]
MVADLHTAFVLLLFLGGMRSLFELYTSIIRSPRMRAESIFEAHKCCLRTDSAQHICSERGFEIFTLRPFCLSIAPNSWLFSWCDPDSHRPPSYWLSLPHPCDYLMH